VFVNGRPALRVDDVGIHAACCGPNMWSAREGSSTVFINGKAAFRIGDPTRHCGGSGKLVDGSGDVIVGDGTSIAPKLHSFDETFILVDAESGKPLADYPYEIRREDGTTARGMTDSEGRTHRTYTRGAESLTLKPG
jgi:hypothetical protein